MLLDLFFFNRVEKCNFGKGKLETGFFKIEYHFRKIRRMI